MKENTPKQPSILKFQQEALISISPVIKRWTRRITFPISTHFELIAYEQEMITCLKVYKLYELLEKKKSA